MDKQKRLFVLLLFLFEFFLLLLSKLWFFLIFLFAFIFVTHWILLVMKKMRRGIHVARLSSSPFNNPLLDIIERNLYNC